MLEGAFEVGESKNPIRGNLCAAAIREVTGHVLHTLAPDSRVSNCCWYKQDRSKIAALYQLLTDAGVKTIKIA